MEAGLTVGSTVFLTILYVALRVTVFSGFGGSDSLQRQACEGAYSKLTDEEITEIVLGAIAYSGRLGIRQIERHIRESLNYSFHAMRISSSPTGSINKVELRNAKGRVLRII